MPELCSQLEAVGIECIGSGPDPIEQYTLRNELLFDVDVQSNVSAVVVGFDVYFNYIKLMKSVNYLRDPAISFIAINEDETLPGPDPNVRIPGTGSLVAAIRSASGRDPIVLGKPHEPMWQFIQNTFHLDPTRTIMIGDRCNTDIKFGRDHGMRTLLVQTGVHKAADVTQLEQQGRSDCVPDFIVDNLTLLL